MVTKGALVSRQVSVVALCFLMKLDGIVRGMMDDGTHQSAP